MAKHYCPMCGEQWNEDVCACGWIEPPKAFGATARSKPAIQRKRRKTILEKKRVNDSDVS